MRESAKPLLALVLVAQAACDPGTGPTVPLTELPRNLTVAEQEVIARSNAFAFDLLNEVNADESTENVFISPLSVTMALGMTMNGTAGETFDEIRQTLGFGGLSQEQINGSYRSLIDLLLTLDRTVDVGIANSVWYRQEFPFEQNFFRTVAESFDAEVRGIEFADPASVDRINDWVSVATNRRIDQILQRITPSDVMFLINAIYFKGAWAQPFDPANTRSEAFAGLGGESHPVRMMNIDGVFRNAFRPEYEALELPYGNTAFSMVVLLPTAGTDINAFVASLDADRWNQIVTGMGESRVMVGMPKFRVEYEKALNEGLKALGMPTAFAPGGADFTPMSAIAGRDLFISSVRHKTFVEVDERGTEAAAVTKVTVGIVSAPPSIRVDRPFVFAIRERFSGTILFVGKIVAPGDGS